MGKITALEITDKKVWEDFLNRRTESNFLQSWSWGQFHKELGNKISYTGFHNGRTLVGVMLSIIEKAKRGKYLSVPAGPIIDWSDKKLTSCFKDEIVNIAKKNNCVFVRVRPQLESDDFSKSVFKSLGLIPAPMHLHAELTNQLNVEKSEEQLLSEMRKATRYEIRKALKLGIKVVESVSDKDIKKFFNLQLSTAKRQGFVPFSFEYLYEQFKIFSNEKQAILYSSFMGSELLAQAFVIFYGNEAVYHYGASTEEGRKYPGAYLIQWTAILEAKKRGIKKYNFWGVANTQSHRFANLSMFKRGFGGEDFEYLHAQDLIINRPKYFVSYIVEDARKKIRKV